MIIDHGQVPHVHPPYVISADLHGLMTRWSYKTGLIIPSESYFDQMVHDLEVEIRRAVNVTVEVVGEHELRNGLSQLIRTYHDPVISLDRAYIDDHDPYVVGFVDLTRAVDESFADVGLHPRPGSDAIDHQLKKYYRQHMTNVVLVDDVIFGGDGLVQVIRLMHAHNCRVSHVVAGIGISRGVEKVRATGVHVACVREYADVADEVCQRDFLACVPMSGRSMLDSAGMWWSAPYFAPFGNAEKWASIPHHAVKTFSEFCLRQSYELWMQIERLNRVELHPQRVPRQIKAFGGYRSITAALKSFF